jgi:hypothetical protein
MSSTSVPAVRLALAAALLGAHAAPARAQLPADSIPLADLGAFAAPAAAWRVAGDVLVDRARDLEATVAPGTGILVSPAGAGRRGDLRTTWEHGDLELSMEVLLPKGGDAGVYLQGRYAVQLTDGWRARRPTFADMGGVRDGAAGVAPRVNAARAPGLWQTLSLLFHAPRFDAAGRKVADARFVRVTLNGAVIHENLRVGAPTAGAPLADERAAGPLVLRGERGPVAFRNVRYKRFAGEPVRLSALRYRAYQGELDVLTAAAAGSAGAPARSGPAEGITSALAGAQDRWALAYEGTLRVPTAGAYRFELLFDWVDDDPGFVGSSVGGGQLTIGGREVLRHPGIQPTAAAVVTLAAGEHPFALTYYKVRPWTNRTEAKLFVEGPGVERQALHASRAPELMGAIVAAPEETPLVLRSFFRLSDADKRTHAASVGDPAGVHYAVDLARGALLAAWRGPFAEATEMWHDRGNDQVIRPLGSVLPLSGAPTLAVLAAEGAPWPDSVAAGGLAPQGYALDRDGRPAFRYRLGTLDVEDRLRPADDSASLRRELRVRGADGTAGLHARLAEGRAIRRLRDGAYLVEGAQPHYVTVERGAAEPVVRATAAEPVVRATARGQELLVPVRLRGGEAGVTYTLTW